jgi:two-component system, LuxR family, sensor kinase FixL
MAGAQRISVGSRARLQTATPRKKGGAPSDPRACEAVYRKLIEINPLPTWVFDARTLAVLAVNPAATGAYGYSRNEFLRMTLRDLWPAEDTRLWLRFLAFLPSRAGGRVLCGCHLTKDFGLIEVEAAVCPLVFGGRAARLLVARDLTERRQLELEILEISERERRRIGQDLHDGLGQHLAGLELMSRVLEQRLAGRNPRAAVRAAEVARHVRDAISQTRALARGLSPVLLESEGLPAALADLAASTEKMFRVACRLECDRPVPSAGRATAIHLFRIAQEAVSNAVKHGQAKHITVHLEQRKGTLVLAVRDDGSGLPRALPRGEGMGLRIMRYRADMIQGSLRVERTPGGGATVICSVPADDRLSRCERS